MNEQAIRDFWQRNPCGEHLLSSALEVAKAEQFFAEYDRFRYALECHIPSCLDQLHLEGQRVLEIGLGQGADSEQLIRRGAIWSGLDLTDEAVARVRLRCQVRQLPFVDCRVGSALRIPWPNDSFDMVFSHGVLHHIPDISAAQREIARVLKPGGRLVLMVYAKHSLNYWMSIFWLRRLGLLLLRMCRVKASGKTRRHVELSQEIGLWRYLHIENFIHRNTDGPDNVYSKVYTKDTLVADFPAFRVLRTFKRFMHAPPLPVNGLPGSELVGWHLWGILEKERERRAR
jgi:SAM-dependent methyltransferase